MQLLFMDMDRGGLVFAGIDLNISSKQTYTRLRRDKAVSIYSFF